MMQRQQEKENNMGHPEDKSSSGNPNDAARSVTVNFTNSSSSDLYLSSANLKGGIWTTNLYPPQTIPKGTSATWASESNGFATGTEGSVEYFAFPAQGKVTVSWDNPYSGSNSYGDSAPYRLSINGSGGGGNNATRDEVIKDR